MLVPAVSARYSALVELTRESLLLEQRLKPITSELNAYPLRINKQTWKQNLAAAEEVAYFLVDYCQQLTGDDSFRPNSPADCKRILGVPSSDKDSLSELAVGGNLLAAAVLDARSAISRHSQLKAWGSYAESGFVQAYWDSNGTPHGRYTSDSPCLNNRIELIRETIEPSPGCTFLSMDLGQAEYVTWASLSGDEVLSQAFQEGKDFHLEMALSVKELVPEWIPGEDLRAAGKTLNFAILYQMQPHTLARRLGCPVAVATKIIDAYYSWVPQASIYIQDVLARAEEFGYVETYYGRRRYCPDYGSLEGKAVHEEEKTLWNHVNAGTAAEVTKWKQLRVWEALRRAEFTETHVRLALQMYDETIWHVRDDCLDDVRALGEEAWTQPEPGFLVFRSKIQTGSTWGEASR